MGRTPKPWYWKERKAYYATINGKRRKLGTSLKKAREELKRILSKPPRNVAAPDSFLTVMDEYLDWAHKNRSPQSFNLYQSWIQRFVDEYPELRIGSLSQKHLHRWVSSHPEWGTSTQRIALQAVLRGLRWAEEHLGIPNPVPRFPLPPSRRRVDTLSLEDFKTILRATKDKELRAILVFCWDCGCRPKEARDMEARHVDLVKRRAVFPAEESKGKRTPRAVYFATDRALRIVQKRLGRGHVFQNKGEPWTKPTLNSRLRHLQKKTGVKVYAYMFRHTWITRKLLAGVDSHVVATLAGHANTNMIDRVYSHVSDSPDFLLDQAAREPRKNA